MPHRTGWKQLTTGLICLAAIVTIALLILVFARVGRLHGKTFELFVETQEASGVIPGTEVWLDGRRVGLVKDISFLPTVGTDSVRLVIRADVLEAVRGRIRQDSRTRLQSGGSFLGAPVVYLSSGTTRTAAVNDGDTLVSEPSFDVQATLAQGAVAAHEFPAIMGNVRVLSAQLTSTAGTLGALGADTRGLQPRVAEAQARASRIMASMHSPAGTVGRMTSGSRALQMDAQFAMAQADSVRALLASNKTSLGRFRRDSTLLRDMADIRATLAAVAQRAASTHGTLGRARADLAIQRALAHGTAQLDSLLADVHAHPLRYLVF
jgi:phospholipid/cholesterol/gamma-HCH transport system substrate-binding protein